MPCDEWCRLVERYRRSVHSYHEAANALGVLPGAAFNKTWQQAERARAKSDDCRAALLHHEHRHACLEIAELEGAEELVLGDQGQSGG